MIPLRDSIPNVHRPYAVWAIIGLNAIVFLFEATLSQNALLWLFHNFGIVPQQYSGLGIGEIFTSPLVNFVPFLTHMFIHSGLMHFVLNMWVLWIFADNIEDVMGTGRFIVFYLLCGLGAALAHMLFNLQSPIPVVGASGATAGVMGAYFILYPYGRVVTLIPIFFIPWFVELPAVIFLGLWFTIQIMSGFAAGVSGQQGGVAWWAHAGGFVVGIALLPLFKIAERCYYCYDKSSKQYSRKDAEDA
jgi:membrane associated rhomboid family serine protease